MTCASKGPEGTARGFFASPPEQIVMCANRLRDESEIERDAGPRAHPRGRLLHA